jgi:hypothetical protein
MSAPVYPRTLYLAALLVFAALYLTRGREGGEEIGWSDDVGLAGRFR